MPTELDAETAAQLVIDPVKDAVIDPFGKVPRDRVVVWEVRGQIAPRAAGTQDLADRVHQRAQVHFRRAAAVTARRHQRRQERPLRVGQVAGVRSLGAHPSMLAARP